MCVHRLLTSTLRSSFFSPGKQLINCLLRLSSLIEECIFPCDLFSGRSVTTQEHESNYQVATCLLNCQHCHMWQKGSRPSQTDERPVISGVKNVLETLGKKWMWWAPPTSLGLFVRLLLHLPLIKLQQNGSLWLGRAADFYREGPVIGLSDMSQEDPLLCLFGWLVCVDRITASTKPPGVFSW